MPLNKENGSGPFLREQIGAAQMCCTFPMHWWLISHSQSTIFKKNPKWGEKSNHSLAAAFQDLLLCLEYGCLQLIEVGHSSAFPYCRVTLSDVNYRCGAAGSFGSPVVTATPTMTDKMRHRASDRLGQLIAQHIKFSMNDNNMRREEKRGEEKKNETTRGQTVHIFTLL